MSPPTGSSRTTPASVQAVNYATDRLDDRRGQQRHLDWPRRSRPGSGRSRRPRSRRTARPPASSRSSSSRSRCPGSPVDLLGLRLRDGRAVRRLGGYTPYQICESGLGPDKPTVFGGSGTVNVPVWIAGDVCTSGGNSPIRNPTTGSPITVHIGGFIYGSNGPSYIVGAPGNNVANFEAIGGCYDKHTNSGQLPLACDNGGNATTCGGNSGIYSSGFAASTQVVTPPSFSRRSGAERIQPGRSPARRIPARRRSRPAPGRPISSTRVGAGSAVADTSLGTQNLITALGANAFVCRTANGTFAWTPPTSRRQGLPSRHGLSGRVPRRQLHDGRRRLHPVRHRRHQRVRDRARPRTRIRYTDGATNGSIYIDGTLTLTNDASICSHQDFNAAGTTCTIPTAPGAAHSQRVLVDLQPRERSCPRSRCRVTRSSSRRPTSAASTA